MCNCHTHDSVISFWFCQSYEDRLTCHVTCVAGETPISRYINFNCIYIKKFVYERTGLVLDRVVPHRFGARLGMCMTTKKLHDDQEAY